MSAVFFEPRAIPHVPEAHASYVVLDPKFAAEALKKSLTAWMSGGSGERLPLGMESAVIDLGGALKPPDFLTQGKRYPGAWQPSDVSPLPDTLPDVSVPSVADSPVYLKKTESSQGVWTRQDGTLNAAGFAFPVLKEKLTERSGHCRFFVETEKDGSVVHLLLLTPRTSGAAAFELMLFRGRATGAVRGTIEISWALPKP